LVGGGVVLGRISRDNVFVAGGQPSVTYVKRDEEHIEREFARAIAAPGQIVSLSGPSKSGKTVLCKSALEKCDHMWIDGGEITDAANFWQRVAHGLDLPTEVTHTSTRQGSGSVNLPVLNQLSASGAYSRKKSDATKRAANPMADALERLIRDRIVLVIDDFHYIKPEHRTDLMRNLKSAVFNGLKVVLLSVTHRAFDAITAETELTGRLASIILPRWSAADLRQIAEKGFNALSIKCADQLTSTFSEEAQESPFLMQKFCWELCYAHKIDTAPFFGEHTIPDTYNPTTLFERLAEDAGLPIYRKLAAGPQSRRKREKRPLRSEGVVDIYEATLLALAHTGPKAEVKYDELRSALNSMLSAAVPQKNEISSALKHLAQISRKIGVETAIDYDEDARVIHVADPYLRFFLRWRVRQQRPQLSIPEATLDLRPPSKE
jgi:hypothetical protein